MASLDSSRFKFIADALNGAGVFRPTVSFDGLGHAVQVGDTALTRYPRESLEKFARRNEVAWYENHLRSACVRFVGYLAKKPPNRQLFNPLLEAIAADCDWRGNALGVFWQNFMIEAKARGCMLLLVDMPEGVPDTMAAQMDSRWLPYLTPIAPEEVVAHAVDARGNVTMCEINVTHEGRRAVKGWDENGWWVREGDRRIAGEDYNLGRCPVIAFNETWTFGAQGEFAQIADMSKRLFNMRSELDEILRAQTFSLLCYHVPPDQQDFDTATVAQAIGTHNMLIYRGNAPEFIAPPDGPASMYLEAITKLEEAIKRAALVVESPDQQSAESGLALTIRFQALNSALTSFARRMEDFERRMWAVVCAWLDLPTERVSTAWEKDYALSDLKAELEILGAMQLSALPTEAIRMQQKRVAQLAFSSAEPDDLSDVLLAIDQSEQEIQP